MIVRFTKKDDKLKVLTYNFDGTVEKEDEVVFDDRGKYKYDNIMKIYFDSDKNLYQIEPSFFDVDYLSHSYLFDENIGNMSYFNTSFEFFSILEITSSVIVKKIDIFGSSHYCFLPAYNNAYFYDQLKNQITATVNLIDRNIDSLGRGLQIDSNNIIDTIKNNKVSVDLTPLENKIDELKNNQVSVDLSPLEKKIDNISQSFKTLDFSKYSLNGNYGAEYPDGSIVKVKDEDYEVLGSFVCIYDIEDLGLMIFYQLKNKATNKTIFIPSTEIDEKKLTEDN